MITSYHKTLSVVLAGLDDGETWILDGLSSLKNSLGSHWLVVFTCQKS